MAEAEGHFEVRENEWPPATFKVHWVTADSEKFVPVTFSPYRLEQLRKALNEHAGGNHGQ